MLDRVVFQYQPLMVVTSSLVIVTLFNVIGYLYISSCFLFFLLYMEDHGAISNVLSKKLSLLKMYSKSFCINGFFFRTYPKISLVVTAPNN